MWYWFGTLGNGWRPFTERDKKLSEQMTAYLINFAKTEKPNNDDLPLWLPIIKSDDEIMIFGDIQTQMDSVDVEKLTYTMMTKPAVGE